MTHLSIDDIKKLKNLAKIDLTQEEEANYLNDLNNILDHVSQISEFKDDGINQKYEFDSIVRQDVANEHIFNREIIFQNIPQKSNDNFVKVPKVIKK